MFCIKFFPRSFSFLLCFFFFNDTATTEIYTLSLHDALPIRAPAPSCCPRGWSPPLPWYRAAPGPRTPRATTTGTTGTTATGTRRAGTATPSSRGWTTCDLDRGRDDDGGRRPGADR